MRKVSSSAVAASSALLFSRPNPQMVAVWGSTTLLLCSSPSPLSPLSSSTCSSSCRRFHSTKAHAEAEELEQCGGGGGPFVVRSQFPPVRVQREPFTDTLRDCLQRHAAEQPGRAAFIDAENPAERITFADFAVAVRAIAQFLDGSVGFGGGDVAGLVAPNSWHALAVFMGAALQGGCTAPMNPLLTGDELKRVINEAGCKVVFCSDLLLQKIAPIQRHCPTLKHLVLIPSRFPEQALPDDLPASIVQWSRVVGTKVDEARPLPAIDVERDLMLLPFSSGTTGPPKGVMLAHRNVGTMCRIFNIHLDEQILKKMEPGWDWKKEHTMLILPQFHIYGFVLGVNCILSGGTGVSFRRFDLDLFCRTVQQYKMKNAFLVPPILVLLAKSAKLARYDLSSLRAIMTGAAPAGADLLEEVKRQIPSVEQICQGYGMTEQSMCSHLPVFGMDNPKAVGRLISNYEMKVVDIEKGTPLPVGQQGELYTRSPTTMLGYLNRPEATAETIDKDGWLKTGDIGYCDADGWTYVVDRLKELIKVKGFQVAPAELEDLLLSHPKIKDCAVVGVPDELAGELPKAFVVKAEGEDGQQEELTEKEVKEFIRGKVAVYKQLKRVEFVREIPKSPSGKILRRLLREQQNNAK